MTNEAINATWQSLATAFKFKPSDDQSRESAIKIKRNGTKMTMKTTVLRRLAAGVGAIALALVGVGAISTAASAEQPADGVAPGNAEAGSTGTLHVHKRAGSQGNAGNGAVINPPVPGTALDGATFELKRVGVLNAALICTTIDLATSAGWAAAEDAVGANPAAPGTGTTEGSLCVDTTFATQSKVTGAVTEGSGEATFDALPLGLYYVVESVAPANVVEKALPFYVTVPFPSGTAENSTWLYNVHVYPKNAVVNKGTKTINLTQTDLVLNADVTWTIEQVIPTLTGSTSEFTEASVSDLLDSRLTYKSATVAIVDPVGADIVAADYGFTNSPEGTLKWTFTEVGLAKLKANQGKTLKVTLTTNVTSVGSGATAGQISNKGTVSFNDKPTDTTIPYTYWGQLQLTKRGMTENGQLLAGAKFEVFDNASGTPASCAPAKPTTGALANGVSGSDGVVDWTRTDAPGATVEQLSLWILNSNTAADPAPTKVYCVYETEAPAGYSIGTPNPRAVTVSTGTAVLNSIQVVNPKKEGPNLPLTGSTGTAAMSIAGMALVTIGAAAIVLTRRNRREHADQ